MKTATKISDTELEIEEEPKKYILSKKQIEKQLVLFQKFVTEYQDLLKKFDE